MTKSTDSVPPHPPASHPSNPPGSGTLIVTQSKTPFSGILPAQGQGNVAGGISRSMDERSVKSYKKAVVKDVFAKHMEQREAERKKANPFINWLKRVIFGPDIERDVKSFVKQYAPNSKVRRAISETIAEHIGEFDLRVVTAYAEAVRRADGAEAVPPGIENISKLFEEELYKNFAVAFPDRKMTLADATLIGERPDLAAKVIQNGRMENVSCQSFARDESGSIGDLEHPLILSLNCNLDNFAVRVAQFCSTMNESLFSEDVPTQDAAVDILLTQIWHYFIKDGINRREIPDMNLPRKVKVVGNMNGIPDIPDVLKKTEDGDQNKKMYIKYILNQFKKAYGDRALQAFYVYMQNFTGSGNTSHGLAAIQNITRVQENSSDLTIASNGINSYGERYVTMTMDENFNVTYHVVEDITPKEYKELLLNDERRNNNNQLKLIDIKDPNLLFDLSENGVAVVVIHSYIPAAHNPDGANLYDQYDQRPNKGKQETNMSIIVSNPPKWPASLK
ncbi:MAG: hypothetical protein LBF42_02765 [Puniceicoccales bacterium]|jgi:hypothetical protein|nr:hypothetical protein [Puniceicoccales bacterium]